MQTYLTNLFANPANKVTVSDSEKLNTGVDGAVVFIRAVTVQNSSAPIRCNIAEVMVSPLDKFPVKSFLDKLAVDTNLSYEVVPLFALLKEAPLLGVTEEQFQVEIDKHHAAMDVDSIVDYYVSTDSVGERKLFLVMLDDIQHNFSVTIFERNRNYVA